MWELPRLGRSSPPEWYVDGCTFFPNKLGRISHKHICNEHDKNYWTRRLFVDKFVSDFQWFIGINKVHFKYNRFYWFIVSVILTTLGYMVLSTFGWLFWKGKPFIRKNENK